MKIEILGTGCPKCETVANNAEQAVGELGIQAEIVKVMDMAFIPLGQRARSTPLDSPTGPYCPDFLRLSSLQNI